MLFTSCLLVMLPALIPAQFLPKFIPADSLQTSTSVSSLITKNKTSSTILTRKKRFLVFPANSAMTLSACMAKGGMILSPPAFVFTWDWDLAFNLPDDTSILKRVYPPFRIKRQRSDRYDLYETMEGLLERQGLDGRACVLRALCEAQQMLAPGKDGLMEDLFHAIFSLPQDTRPDEDMDLQEHDTAHRHGRSNQNCEELYSSCPISLINLALW